MRHVAVDWSGARNPAGKIWLAEAMDGRLVRLDAPASRDSVIERLADYQRRDSPTVVGLDFSFSFPAWFCDVLGARTVVDTWRLVATQGTSWLERCESPFWGRAGRGRPDVPAHLRRTEERVGLLSSVRPKSTFQIGGAGAVGTGSLRGMPHLLTLRDAGCAVWPFDAPSLVTIVEIYPRLFTGAVVKSREATRTAHLDAVARDWPAEFRRAAERSEDAFDAALSAVEMSVRWTTLPAQDTLDVVSRMEGEIWTPAPRH
ncbi:MAG: hypothetical protein U0Q11_00940 [Vicinamibacterales bacterium]